MRLGAGIERSSLQREEEKTKGSGKKWVDFEEKVWVIHCINICIFCYVYIWIKVELEMLSKR